MSFIEYSSIIYLIKVKYTFHHYKLNTTTVLYISIFLWRANMLHPTWSIWFENILEFSIVSYRVSHPLKTFYIISQTPTWYGGER